MRVLGRFVDEEDVDALKDKIAREHPNVKDIAKWLSVFSSADLERNLAEIHCDRTKKTLAEELDAARADPELECDHGTYGGLHRRSDTGKLLCPSCHAEGKAIDSGRSRVPVVSENGQNKSELAELEPVR